MAQPYVMSVLFVCGLMLVGVALRAWVRPIRALFIPASVVGGLIGLAVIQAGLRVGPQEPYRYQGDIYVVDESASLPDWYEPGTVLHHGVTQETIFLMNSGFLKAWPPARWSAQLSNILDGWPGLLIAVVFASLLIERPGNRFSDAVIRAGRAGIAAWILILGQVFLGLLVTALLVARFYDVPPTFGQLIEVGMAGGFGSSTAMGAVYANQGFAAGRDLGYLFATVGLLWGTLSGIVLINIGVRRGWTAASGTASPGASPRAQEKPWRATAPDSPDLREAADPPVETDHGLSSPRGLGSGQAVPLGFARIRPEIIDPLAFQLCLLAAAFGIGFAMQQAFLWVMGQVADARTNEFVSNVPLFLFTLLGGWSLRELMHLLRVGHLIDPPSINRLAGIAMEILIVSALVTLRIEAAAAYLWPVVALLVVGCAWCVFCLVWLSPRLLPREYWFELGLINYGMSTGTTAQGLMLLRIVDPDLDTRAAEDYAAAAPLSAPFIGGGVLTIVGIPLALGWAGYWPVIAACGAAMIGLYVLGRMLAKADEERQERRGFEVMP